MSNVELLSCLKEETLAAEPDLRELIGVTRRIMVRSTQKQSGRNTETVGNSWTKYSATVRDDEEDFVAKKYPPAPPELADLPVNTEIQQQIEMLGEDMLQEAFECLGEQGQALLEEYLACDSDDRIAKAKVCKKLIRLVNRISEKSEIKFKEDDIDYYPPVRISPKLIGTMPNPAIEPTCLGKSILITGFFHKAGVPTLHGGLVMSKTDNELISQSRGIEQVLKFSEIRNLDVSGNYTHQINTIIDAQIAELVNHRGFHAATYIRFKDEEWIQLDPNYGSAFMTRGANEHLDRTYEALLQDKKEGYIGSERQIYMQNNFDLYFTKAQKAIAPFIPSSKEIEELIEETETEQMYRAFLDSVFKPVLKLVGPDLPKNDPLHKIQPSIKKFINAIEGRAERTVREAIQGIVRSSFTSEEHPDLLEAFERLKTDRHFLRRRIADLQLMPVSTLLSLQSAFFEEREKNLGMGGNGHVWVNLGLPEYKVGISALSDTAVYYGDDLPLSTWLSYWPSKVSLHEHFDQTPTKAQEYLKYIALKFSMKQSMVLTNPSTVVMLRKALEDFEKGKENGENQRRQVDEAA